MKHLFLLMVACGLWCVAQCNTPPLSAPFKGPYYTIVLFPNPARNKGVMAIVPTAKAPKDKGYFRSYAVLCHMNSRKIKKFETLQIFVFKSSDFAFRFRQYQNKRNGAILTEKDYRQLTHLWKDVPVFYVFIGKGATGEKSAFYYPQDKPSSWWKPLVQKPKTKTATTQ